jgi:hypothetical protein
MNSYTHTNYTFNKVTKQVTLTGFSAVLQNIKYIKNLTADTVIYDPLSFTTLGGTLAGSVLTLTFDTNIGAMTNTDILEIIVEAGSVIGNNGTISASAANSITLGGTAQTLFAANSSRMGWSIQNTSNLDLYVNDLGTATITSYRITPGSEYNPASVNSSLISILGATTGQTFVAREWNVPNITGSTLFVQGATPAGQQPAASSHPVIPATNYTESVQKEWKVISSTGTPTAAVGDIVLQTIKNNAGTVGVTWFNMTTSTIFTVAPVVANLSQNTNTGMELAGTQNGRQSWSMTAAGFSPVSGTAVSCVQTTDNTVLSAQTSYTVPAGKRLRITYIGLSQTASSTLASNTRNFSDFVLRNGTAVDNNGAPVFRFRMHSANSLSTTAFAQDLTTCSAMFQNGELDFGAGRIIYMWMDSGTTDNSSNLSMNGVLYNA